MHIKQFNVLQKFPLYAILLPNTGSHTQSAVFMTIKAGDSFMPIECKRSLNKHSGVFFLLWSVTVDTDKALSSSSSSSNQILVLGQVFTMWDPCASPWTCGNFEAMEYNINTYMNGERHPSLAGQPVSVSITTEEKHYDMCYHSHPKWSIPSCSQRWTTITITTSTSSCLSCGKARSYECVEFKVSSTFKWNDLWRNL